MTKRIFRSIFFVTLGVFLASVVLFMGVLFEYFTGIQRKQLRMQTTLAAQGVENEGIQYFKGLETNDFRITWIN
ncbi:MAG: PAS domain-containing sensor histidine kinase, partial [Oscillospiraceae bacterium]|nr:PAS domain-containing sensor histidine kinase [Oscillospiraceae bacterium]